MFPQHALLDMETQAPSGSNVITKDGASSVPSSSSMAAATQEPAKKGTRRWAAWTRQEEENFFNALRQVGKNFEKITSRVQSKNKDQDGVGLRSLDSETTHSISLDDGKRFRTAVRHYYYRLVRRINKLLGPGFCLDAKNSKDANAAMLRWWALLEKHSCTASKLHLKPRRFKLFIEALEAQLLKDRNKTKRKHISQEETCSCTSSATPGNDAHPVKVLEANTHDAHKVGVSKGASLKRNGSLNSNFNRGDMASVTSVKQRRRSVGIVASAAYRRWEKAAIAGVSLVADAAEQLERAGSNKTCSLNQGAFNMPMTGQNNTITIGNNSYPLQSPALTGMCSHQIGEALAPPSVKLKLQLFPIDEDTRKSLEKDAHNPHLELTLSARKRISSVLEHLNRKWGNSSIASGELMLFPYSVQQEDMANYERWTLKDTVASAGDVYARIGSPSIFRLRYGWFSNVELRPRIVQESSEALCLDNCMQSHNTYDEANTNMGVPDDKGIRDNAMEPSLPVEKPAKKSVQSSEDGLNFTMPPPSPLIGTLEIMVGSSSVKCNDGSKQKEDVGTVLLGEWDDSLTNLSVGDLLSEASKACCSDPINSSSGGTGPCLQPTPFSYDSFDAAVAAHLPGYQLPSGSSRVPNSTIWNGEETCDEFSFRLPPVVKGEDRNPSNSTSIRVSSQITCSNSLSFHGRFKALSEPCLSDISPSKDLKNTTEPAKGSMLDTEKLDSAKDFSLTEVYWPESLGPLDLDMPSSRYQCEDLVFGDNVSLGDLSELLANSFGAFRSCSSFGVDRKDPLTCEARGASTVLDDKVCTED